MPKVSCLAMLMVLGCPTLFAVQPDKAGCADHPLFPTRMPNYRIEACETREFASYDFWVTSGPKRTIEGRFTFITYAVENRNDDQTGIAVVRNYENALKAIGGTIVASNSQSWVNGFVVADGREVWAQAERGNGKIWLRIVERQAMEQHVVADAATFARGLEAQGHIAVDGIYFDTGKAVLKPESTPALAEVATLLAADPTLKLWIVGHTDSTGVLADNMRLSEARAGAVVTALTTAHGIAPGRLAPFGVGPLCPVTSNESIDGRAKNRRVEIVKQ